MYEDGYTLHIGVDGEEKKLKDMQWSLTSAMKITAGQMTSLVAAVDGDSFFEWGEKIKDGAPMHITLSFSHPFSPLTLFNVWAGMARLAERCEVQLMDYLVITDREVWSADARVVIGEDIWHLAHSVEAGTKTADLKLNSYAQASWLA